MESVVQRYKSGDKALITNTVALLIVVIALFQDEGDVLLSIGLFALSGAITNWLAIHMLFEKVPFMIGSGVIPLRFEAFKSTIKSMIMQQFFNRENLQKFIAAEEQSIANWFKPEQIIDKIDYDRLFNRLVEAIMESSFGGMLAMMGGAEALEGLKDSFIEKIKLTLAEMVQSDSFKSTIASSINADALSAEMVQQIEQIVDRRLEELTPEMVKEIVQELIREHLGWLVVWGGVVGGVIGLFAGLAL